MNPLMTSPAARALAIVNAMAPIDLFDYLADHTDSEPRSATERIPECMRVRVLVDLVTVGAPAFLARVQGPPATHSGIIPAAPDAFTLDDDTGAPIMRPAHLIRGGNAYWAEHLPNGTAYLMSAPVNADGSIDWGGDYEVEPFGEVPDYDELMSELTKPAN